MPEQSLELYDALAPYYREYSQKKNKYIKSVDEFILSKIPRNCNTLLDVGAGDGIRGMRIADGKKIKYTVLCDPSAEMIKMCSRLNPTELWHLPAEDLPESEKKFDVILCLWNVLGHLENSEKRIKSLCAMSKLLSDTGIIFLDVNNRHNASSYGKMSVLKRVVIDFFCPDETRGDASYEWKFGEKSFPGMGHLFTPREMKKIIKKSNLTIARRVCIHYESGRLSNNPFSGQLVYLLKKWKNSI